MFSRLLSNTCSVLKTLVFPSTILYCTLWIFSYLTCGVCKSKARLDGKTVVLTGCTAGIGIATAKELARRGARLIMACRNVEKATEVRQQIVDTTNNNNVVVMHLDVSVMSSVRKFAEEVIKNESRLDVLIHNAALADGGDETTEDGFHKVWATNTFGPFLLNHLLIELLKKAGTSRIIYVASLAFYFGDVNLETPNPAPTGRNNIMNVYGCTKFAGVLLATELARRTKGLGVTVNSLHPGAVDTTLFGQSPLWMQFIKWLISPMLKTVEQGAQTTIYLAVSEEVEGVSGKFFLDCMQFPQSKRTQDVALAERYWKQCEEIVTLRPSDPHIN